MLHAYVKSYFVVYGLDGWTFDDLPERRRTRGHPRARPGAAPDDLRPLQNHEIPNHTGRTPVYGFKDFVKRWGARFEVTNAMGVGGA